jgi:hypothetical protein
MWIVFKLSHLIKVALTIQEVPLFHINTKIGKAVDDG